tara:strand:- start:1448 stop:2392 length:945 start_codon:yes stop_codon:yes gene_type:complete
MSIFVEVLQTSGGRTGHKLKDYLTAIIYFFLCNYKIILNETWIFPENDHNNHLSMFNLIDNGLVEQKPIDYQNVDYSLSNWSGMDYNKYIEINEYLQSLKKNNDKYIILRLKDATRILLSDVYNWEKNNLIPFGKYESIINYLRHRYYLVNEKIELKNLAINIAIHIRKGDVYMRPLHQSVKYYENIIKQLNTIKVNKIITIYSEKWENYDEIDVYELKYLQNEYTKINIIFSYCLYEYFSEILGNFIFVPTIGQGSFSDMIINYKSHNSLVIINYELRQNKYIDNMNDKLFFTDNSGKFNINKLNTFLLSLMK